MNSGWRSSFQQNPSPLKDTQGSTKFWKLVPTTVGRPRSADRYRWSYGAPPCRLVYSQGKQRCWSGSSQIGSGISTEVDGGFCWMLVFGRKNACDILVGIFEDSQKNGENYWIWKVIGECSCNCLPQIMVSREESISGCILWTCLCALVAVDICPFTFYIVRDVDVRSLFS